jgi:hypothetical protein
VARKIRNLRDIGMFSLSKPERDVVYYLTIFFLHRQVGWMPRPALAG